MDVTSSNKVLALQSWESHAEGVSIALSIRSQTDPKIEAAGFLTIYVKNTSETPKRCFIDSGDLGFQIFTLDHVGTWQPLRNYHPRSLQFAASITIDSKHTMSHVIELSPYDLALIKVRPVKCQIDLVDVATGQSCKIESSPKLLVETIKTSPTQ